MIAREASDKKGIDIVIIRVRKISSVSDYFVIASGTSTTHVRAISDHIVKQLKARYGRIRHVEGEREASWILIDAGDAIAHIFLRDTRKYYDLEKLWAKAPQELFKDSDVPRKGSIKKRMKRSFKTTSRNRR